MKLWPRKSEGPTPEARNARKRAEAALKVAKAQTPTLDRIAADLREIREKNHLAEAFEHALRGH
jgi:hypothetical protein